MIAHNIDIDDNTRNTYKYDNEDKNDDHEDDNDKKMKENQKNSAKAAHNTRKRFANDPTTWKTI